jgi:hypothetical protein
LDDERPQRQPIGSVDQLVSTSEGSIRLSWQHPTFPASIKAYLQLRIPRQEAEDLHGIEEVGPRQEQGREIVSKKASARGKKAYYRIKGWTTAVEKARNALGVTGTS